jgi:hypothetical protein
MSTIRHPNRHRRAASAILRALIAWHANITQGQVLTLRQHWPRWPRITPPQPPRGGVAA